MGLSIAILGSALSGGAGQIIEIAERAKLEHHYDIFDNDEKALQKGVVFGRKIVATSRSFFADGIFRKYDGAVVAIGGNLVQREELFNQLVENGVTPVNIIDPTAIFGLSVELGRGNVIAAGSYIGNEVVLGDNNYVLNGVSIQHNSRIGSSNYFSTRATIGAHCHVGDKVRFAVGEILQSHASRLK